MDAFEEVPAGGHFLGAAHTLRHFRDAFYRPLVSDVMNYERWVQKGAKPVEVRANETWKKWLTAYQQPPLDPAIDEALNQFIVRRKLEIQAQA